MDLLEACRQYSDKFREWEIDGCGIDGCKSKPQHCVTDYDGGCLILCSGHYEIVRDSEWNSELKTFVLKL